MLNTALSANGTGHLLHAFGMGWTQIMADPHKDVKALREHFVAESLAGCNYGFGRDRRKARARVVGSVARDAAEPQQRPHTFQSFSHPLVGRASFEIVGDNSIVCNWLNGDSPTADNFTGKAMPNAREVLWDVWRSGLATPPKNC